MNEYKEVSCKCGFTYENDKNEFEIHFLKMGTVFGQELPKKPVPRCKTCKTISILEIIEKTDKNDIFKSMPSLKDIIDKK